MATPDSQTGQFGRLFGAGISGKITGDEEFQLAAGALTRGSRNPSEENYPIK